MIPDIPAPIQITLNGRLLSMALSSIVDKEDSVTLEIMVTIVLRIMTLDDIWDKQSIEKDVSNRELIHIDWKIDSTMS